MQAKFFSKISVLFICTIFFASVVVAQEKPQAVIFYEFDIKQIDNSKLLTEKLNEFIIRLSNEPETTRGFINIAGNTKLAEKIKAYVSENSNLISRIVFNWNLKYPDRPISYFDFYLIPQDAVIPYVQVHEPVICPTLSIDTTTKVIEGNPFITFTASVKGGEEDSVITYKWNVSAGKIVEGQGTSVIKVDAKDAKEITATVEIGGVDEECLREVSFTTKIK